MVKISGFMAAVRFFHLLNIIAPAWLRNVPSIHPPPIGNNKKGLEFGPAAEISKS